MVSVEEKVRVIVEEKGSLLGTKHEGHEVGLSIVDKVQPGDSKALNQKRITWIAKLKATALSL